MIIDQIGIIKIKIFKKLKIKLRNESCLIKKVDKAGKKYLIYV